MSENSEGSRHTKKRRISEANPDPKQSNFFGLRVGDKSAFKLKIPEPKDDKSSLLS